MMNFLRNPIVFRVFFFLIGFSLAMMGVRAYQRGEPGHRNYWGALVTIDASIVFGLLIVAAACLPKGVLIDLSGKTKKRLARKSRKDKPTNKK